MIDVILDVDTGTDDALAILFAARSPQLRLRALTCVGGNADIDRVVTNTLSALDLVGVDISVGRGSQPPTVPVLPPARRHGRNGIGDVELTPPLGSVSDLPADELIATILESSDQPLTLVALGPLTNIARLVQRRTRLCQHMITTLALVSPEPSPTYGAPFNAACDLAAVEMVMAAPLIITPWDLDEFYAVRSTADDLAALDRGDAVARTAAQLLRAQQRRRGILALGDAAIITSLACGGSRDPETLRQIFVTTLLDPGGTSAASRLSSEGG